MEGPTEGDARIGLTRTYEELAAARREIRMCCSPADAAGEGMPEDVLGPGLGCGDPVRLAGLRPGQTVLDLGSGAGRDCFRAADQVGAEGRVLKPGGTLAFCDVLLDAPMPSSLLELLPDGGACLQGIPHEGEYLAAMEAAGFVEARVEREYPQPIRETGTAGEGGARLLVRVGETGETVGSVDLGAAVDLDAVPRSFNGKITARKPGGLFGRAASAQG